jgi:hypothetical protein
MAQNQTPSLQEFMSLPDAPTSANSASIKSDDTPPTLQEFLNAPSAEPEQTGAVPAKTPTTFEQLGGFAHNVGTGVKAAGSDILNAVRGIAPATNESAAKSIPGKVLDTAEDVANGINNLSGITTVVDSVKNAGHILGAYEDARSKGASVIDALKSANERAKQADTLTPALAKALDAWKKNPTAETTRALTDAAAALATIYAGGKVMPGAVPEAEETAAAEKAATPKPAATAEPKEPGAIKRAFSPTAATQPGAKSTLQAGAESAAKDAGVKATVTPAAGIRSLMDEPIAQASKLERGLYDTVNKAAETDMKDLYDYRVKLQDAIEDPKNIANEDALNEKLKVVNQKIADGESKVQTALGKSGSDAIQRAQAATQQRYAMEDGAKKLFDNESVVSGNVQHGVPETANVDALIKNAEALDKPSKFAPRGTPTRLQQMFGEEGAKQFKQGLYDAQKKGITVADRNTVIKWVAGGAGTLSGLYELMK